MKPETQAVERVKKLLAYALDGSAGVEESKNAACRAVETARNHGIKATELFSNTMPRCVGPRPSERPSPWRFRFPVGKYKGQTIQQAMEKDAAYCRWMLQNATNLDAVFRNALSECLYSGFD